MRTIILALALAAALAGVMQLGQAALHWAKAWAAPVLIEHAWVRLQNDHAARSEPASYRPWPWADTEPVARLSFPTLNGQDRIALSDPSARNMAFGPVLIDGGPVPAFFGHRDTHFQLLQNIDVGDPIDWEAPDGTIQRYRVTDTAIRHHHDIAVPSGPDNVRMVLVTCWPFDAWEAGGPMRFVVLAERGEASYAAMSASE